MRAQDRTRGTLAREAAVAVDYVIHLECPPKLHFGEGDAFAGTNTLMSLVKARNRADLLAEMAARDGKRPRR